MSDSSVTEDRQQAHSLVDLLPQEKLPAVVRLLRTLADPVARSIADAPIEDEPISDAEIRAVEASDAWLKNHPPIPHEEVLAELGLTLEDFERLGRTPLDPQTSRR
jgi:hypothetical protein